MKKFALLLLALCAALVPIGGLAVPGWAETTVSNIQQLKDALNNTSVMEIIATQTIQINDDVTLNGNGHTLSLAQSATGSVIKIGDDTNKPTVTIQNLVIANGATTVNGGGIYVYAGGVTVDNCVFKENKANQASGGGMYVSSEASGDVTINACTFIGNSAFSGGGGLYISCRETGTYTVTNCTFIDNKLTDDTTGQDNGGNGLCMSNNYAETMSANMPKVINCTFVNTKEDTYDAGEIFSHKDCTITNSLIWAKKAVKPYTGSDPSHNVTSATVTLDHCAVSKNAINSTTVTDGGGCITTLAGVGSQSTKKNGEIEHTVYRDNVALQGLMGKGKTGTGVTTDQLGNKRPASPSIGAVEIEAQSGGDTPLTVATPTFNPAAGTYTGAQSVTISCKTEGATIHYTTDGSDPTKSSTLYTSPVRISTTTTLKAIAVKDGVDSSVATATYTINSGGSGSGSSGSNTPVTPDSGSTGNGSGGGSVTDVNVTLTLERSWTTVQQGMTDTSVQCKANAWAKYSNGTTKTLTPNLSLVLKDKFPWITISGGIVQLSPGTDVKAGEYTVTVKATATDSGKTAFDTATLRVVVVAQKLPSMPKLIKSVAVTLTPRAETLAVEPGGTATATFTATATATMTDGTTQVQTPKLSLKSAYGWITLDANTGVVTAKPGRDVASGSYTATLTATGTAGGLITKTAISVLTVNVTATKFDYELTVAPASLTVAVGQTATLGLRDNVRVEKVYGNGTRQTVNAELTFAWDRGWPSWLTLGANGTVTANPPEAGTVNAKFSVTAAVDGQTRTGEGTLAVNVKDVQKPAKITTNSLSMGLLGVKRNERYRGGLYADGDRPIMWSVPAGALPPGLKLTEGGVISGKIPEDAELKTYTFTVRAWNSAGADEKEFSIKVGGTPPSGWKIETTPRKGQAIKKNSTFDVKLYVTRGDKPITYELGATKGVRDGVQQASANTEDQYYERATVYSDYCLYTCKYTGESCQYEIDLRAINSFGQLSGGTIVKVVKKNETEGKIASPGGAAPSPEYAIILAAEPDGGAAEGVTYFHNGYADEEGNITAVIGKAADGVEDSPYRFDSVDELLHAENLKEQLGNIVALEFRAGAVLPDPLTSKDLSDLKALSELAIDNGNLTSLDLSGNTQLKKLSLFSCEKLETLNVSGCVSLVSLSANVCPNLASLNAAGCAALDTVDMTGSAVADLNLSGCSSLTRLDANGTGITNLDMSACSGLTSLSLADATDLVELTLPTGVTFEDFTLTGSLVTELNLSGCLSMDVLDLSDNAALSALNVSGNDALKELNVPNCAFLLTLNASGCPALEKLIAWDCVKLLSMDLEGSDALRELGVGGCDDMRSLDVNGKSLGHLDLDGLKWLTSVQCDGQFIGGIDMTKPVNLKDYAGNCLYRVSDVQGYDADGNAIETSWNKNTGEVTFASVPADMSYSYDTGLYDYVLDVTLSSAAGPDPDSPTSNRGGGGCDAGLGGSSVLALLTFAALLSSRRGKK